MPLLRAPTPAPLGGSDSKESACSGGDLGPIPGSGSSLGGGNGNPLHFLPGEDHGQRSLVGYSPWGHKESDMTERLTLSLSCPPAKASSGQGSVDALLRPVGLHLCCGLCFLQGDRWRERL